MFCKTLLDDRKRVFTVASGATLAQAADLMTHHKIGALMVLSESGGLNGIFTERDLTRAVAGHAQEAPAFPVERFMTRDVVTCAPDDDLQYVMRLMDQRRIRHVPVVQDGLPVGMVSIRDVVDRLLEETATERDTLRDYVSGSVC